MSFRNTAWGAGAYATLLLLVAYLVAKPFYLFPSGGAQIADAIVVAMLILAILGRQEITRVTGPFLAACILFSTYTLIVNAVWALLLDDLGLLITPVYYFFNTILVYVILNSYGRVGEPLFKVLLVGVVISVCVQLLLSVWMLDPAAERQELFFNNENQLAEWALLSATIFCLLAKHLKVRLVYQLPVILGALFLVSVALSKAALIAAMLLLAIHFSRNLGHFLLVAIAGAIAIYLASEARLIENVVDRLMDIGQQSDDSLHGRGYDRIWLYPQYLLFGAGEFGLYRFPETHIELHSTLGTVVFSYGAIGTFLFGLIFWQLLRLAGWADFLYLAPPIVHGLAHQGLRFSTLWVIFATVAIVGASLTAPERDSGRADARNKRQQIKRPGLAVPGRSDE